MLFRTHRFALLALILGTAAFAHAPIDRPNPRKTTRDDLSAPVQRHELKNGWVVLLSPEPGFAGVVVDVSFRAGALYEPTGKGGMAHLAEHVMAAGTTPETNYQQILEARGGRGFNALTSFDLMTFRVVVPPEEMPLALWAMEDRIRVLPGKLTEPELDRNRRIVLEERALRVEDAPYGSAMSELHRRLFPKPHPLHGTTVGLPEELATVTVEDIRTFVGRYLVPRNGIITLVGSFDPQVALTWIEKTLGQLPPGERAALSVKTPVLSQNVTAAVREPISRRPRVTFAWTYLGMTDEVADVLQFGALLLSIYTNGAFGMSVASEFNQFTGLMMFLLDVTLDNDKPQDDAASDGEGLLRYLTRAAMPADLMEATFLAWDRITMTQLDSPIERSTLLTQLEYLGKNPLDLGRYNERQWRLNADQIQTVARRALDRPRVILHARPIRPRPPRKEREE